MTTHREYIPDGWNIIKSTTNSGVDYFVFGSWSGGYLHGDSWRINSGITRVEEHKEGKIHDYLFHGYTGSVYRCAKHGEGKISGYAMGVLKRILENNNAEIISLKEFEQKND